VELDPKRANLLRGLDALRPGRVTVHHGDANDKLLTEILPKFPYSSYWRVLMLLDPYNIGIDWRVTKAAGELRTVDLFLNFMVMDANMNVLKLDKGAVDPAQAARMDVFWGDPSWRDVMYKPPADLLPGLDIDLTEKQSNETLAKAFAERLHKVAGFKYVVEPLPVKIETGQIVYYLYFASNNDKAYKIASSIFKRWRK
jgi:three-Cys-motif partner protein